MGTTDHMTIGPTPAEEDCQQVGMPNYDPVAARRECEQFLELIRKSCGPPPDGARLGIKQFAHDFGTYMEVVVYFDTLISESLEYALKVESEAPSRWE